MPNCARIESNKFMMYKVLSCGICSHSQSPASIAFTQATTSYSYPVYCFGHLISFNKFELKDHLLNLHEHKFLEYALDNPEMVPELFE